MQVPCALLIRFFERFTHSARKLQFRTAIMQESVPQCSHPTNLWLIRPLPYNFKNRLAGKQPEEEWRKIKALTAEDNFAFVSTHTRSDVIAVDLLMKNNYTIFE